MSDQKPPLAADTLDGIVRQWAAKNLPTPDDLDVAARVCIQMADICENTMSWWQRLFYDAREVRNTGRKCAEMAIRLRTFKLPNASLQRQEPRQ
jgi:hypothetical protein